ncbi:MAG: hypothetical protein U9P14_05815 [Gemmatimonadota bacterium]|nr:hypothetical protein [Gemmatimonadota bacterium]
MSVDFQPGRLAILTRIGLAPLVLGMSSVLAQVVLLRETAASFQGNELCFGIVLGGWLFWTALGTLAGGRLFDRFRAGTGMLVLLLSSLAWLFPASLLLIRAARILWRVRPGEVVGFTHVFGISFLLLAPLCLVLGAVFPAAVRLAGKNGGRPSAADPATAAGWINRAYIIETIGFIAGGLFFNYFLVWYTGSWTVAVVTSGLDLAAAWWVLRSDFRLCRSAMMITVCICTSLCWCGLLWGTWTGWIEVETQRLRWRGLNLVETKESPYGNLAVTRDQHQVNFYESGLLVTTIPASSTNEPFFHLPLLLHPGPRRVLVLGGGIGGGLREILKHPVSAVDYVCLDPYLVKLISGYLPPEDLRAAGDSRVTIHYEDGCGYVRRLSTLPAGKRPRYDLLFLSLPDPSTALINRAYSLEFFTAAEALLSPDGILALELSFSETYVGAEMRKLNGSIYKTLKRVFPRVVPVPEYSMLWMATPAETGLEVTPELAVERYEKRNLHTEYMKPEMIYHQLDRSRIADRLSFLLTDFTRLFQSPDPLKEELAAWNSDPAIPLNRDFHPVSYYLQMLLWVSKYSKRTGRFLEAVSRIRPAALVAVILVLFTILAGVVYGNRRSPERLVVPVIVLGNGFAAMVMEVLLLFGFQVLTGFIFSQVALIITLFMAGLAVGSIVSARFLVPRERPLGFLFGAELAIAVFLLLLPGFMSWGSSLAEAGHLAAVKLMVAVLVVTAGFLDGLEFPLGSSMLVRTGERTGTSAGIVYGADLAGSFLGALLASSFLLPVLGFSGTCLVVIAFKVGSIIILGAAKLTAFSGLKPVTGRRG